MKKLMILGLISCALITGCDSNTNENSQGVTIKPSTEQESLNNTQTTENQENVTNQTSQENATNQTSQNNATDRITEEEAKAIALKHAGVLEADASFIKVELDYDNGVWEYEVDFYVGTTEYDYDINATTGAVIAYGKDLKNQATNNSNDQTYITDETAKTIALDHAGVALSEVTSMKVEFDFDKGVAEFEVEFKVGRTEYEYEINAITGEIISFEKDND